MIIEFNSDVEGELQDSYNWYQGQVEGLGEDFLAEIELAYQAIHDFPHAWPLFQKTISVDSYFPNFRFL